MRRQRDRINLFRGLGSGLTTRTQTTPPQIPGDCTDGIKLPAGLQPGALGFLTLSWDVVLHSHQRRAGAARNMDTCTRDGLECCDLEHPAFHNKQRIFSSIIFTQCSGFFHSSSLLYLFIYFLRCDLFFHLKLVNRSIKYLTIYVFFEIYQGKGSLQVTK